MSLVIEVKINYTPIFMVTAQRVTNTGGVPGNDDVSEYEIVKYDGEYSTTTNFGRISHRYGDGANVLAQKALHAAQT